MLRVTTIVCWLGLGVVGLHAQEPDKSKENPGLRFASMVPLNTPIREFRLPQYDMEGKLTGIVTAEEMRKISESRFVLEGLKIVMYVEGEEVGEMVTARAHYDLKSKLLVGQGHVKLTMSQAQSEGEGFIYDVKTRRYAILREGSHRIRLEKSKKQKPKSKKP